MSKYLASGSFRRALEKNWANRRSVVAMCATEIQNHQRYFPAKQPPGYIGDIERFLETTADAQEFLELFCAMATPTKTDPEARAEEDRRIEADIRATKLRGLTHKGHRH